MTLGHGRHIAHRQLQRTAALLAGDKTCDRPVYLVGQKAFRADRDKAEDTVQGLFHRQTVGQLQRPEAGAVTLILEGLARDVAEKGIQFDVNRGGTVSGIVDYKPQVACDLAEHLAGNFLPSADGLEAFDIFRPDQEAIALLILSDIDL